MSEKTPATMRAALLLGPGGPERATISPVVDATFSLEEIVQAQAALRQRRTSARS